MSIQHTSCLPALNAAQSRMNLPWALHKAAPILDCSCGSRLQLSASLPRLTRSIWSSAAASREGRALQPACRATSSTAAALGVAEPAPGAVTEAAEAWTGSRIRETFLRFYEERGHKRLDSASLVPDDPTVLLTIAGMLQFKPIFLGKEPRKYPCVTTTQKCVRTNDIENVGVTARHHTFFEMLGNFSFGDYFKSRAIQLAWELSTEVYGLPAERVWVSVYQDDEEAYRLWRDDVGVPEARIQRLGAEDNFWESGPTGPCGPCTELYYDFYPERGAAGASLEDDSRFIEFYNLVFMESNRAPGGQLSPLASRNIDTGMGLERMAQILQGVPNNYETDLILPILNKAAALAGLEYASATPRQQTALKVIGDHIRAVTYLMSDGVLPSNVGRGYIVRRLLRRVVVKGQLLGIGDVFTPAVASVAVELSRGCDPAVATNAQRIYDQLAREESQFRSSMSAGEKLLQEIMQEAEAAANNGTPPTIPGTKAFVLYDTFGFPLEITQEIAEERGIQVDVAGFEAEMALQRSRSKDAAKVVDMTQGPALADMASRLGSTQFVGYASLEGTAHIVALMQGGQPVESVSAGEEVEVVLDRTPFYAESGGQVGDQGMLASTSGNGAAPEAVLAVRDTQKAAGGQLSVHSGSLQQGVLRVGQQVSAAVDRGLRQRLRANHTATHLLQAALKRVLAQDTAQQGSMVQRDRLRFDFNLPRAMTEGEVQKVEALVNGWVQEGSTLRVREMAIADARAAGAVAMFGEKYGELVRVVEVPGVSMELCGGTHVGNTAEIGAFKVLSESGIASGVRRIEAVAGPAAVDHMNKVDGIVRELNAQLKVKPEEIPARVAGLFEELKAAQKVAEQLKKEVALAKAAALAGSAVTLPNGAKLLVEAVDGVDAKALQDAAAGLQAQLGDPAAVVLLSSPAQGKVAIAAAFSAAVVAAGVQAGKLVGSYAKICGGGGGGRPNLAQAGGKDPSKIPAARDAAVAELTDALSKL